MIKFSMLAVVAASLLMTPCAAQTADQKKALKEAADACERHRNSPSMTQLTEDKMWPPEWASCLQVWKKYLESTRGNAKVQEDAERAKIDEVLK